MASGSGLATALAALKAHALTTAVVGTLVVGGGAATVGVATGVVQVPGISTHQGSDTADTQRAQSCTTNGDAARLAAIYAPMFDGSATSAQQTICTLFAGSGGHAYGMGDVQLILETTAAIERNGNDTACLSASSTASSTASSAHGQPTETGKPANPGNGGNAGNGGNSGNAGGGGAASATIPTATASGTTTIINAVIAADGHGTPLAQLARACGATPTTGNPNGGTDQGQGQGQPATTPGAGANPGATPGGKPTGTPGQGHGHP